MPKKTGSQSLVGMCEAVASVVGDWHGCEWDGSGRRIMVVRNPYERLASIYWHQRVEGNNLFGTPDPVEWLMRFIEALPQWRKGVFYEWLASQSQMAESFHPRTVCRLEDGLDAACKVVGVNVPVQFRHVGGDKYTKKLPFAETFQDLPNNLRDAVDAYCAPDMESWY